MDEDYDSNNYGHFSSHNIDEQDSMSTKMANFGTLHRSIPAPSPSVAPQMKESVMDNESPKESDEETIQKLMMMPTIGDENEDVGYHMPIRVDNYEHRAAGPFNSDPHHIVEEWSSSMDWTPTGTSIC